MKKLFTFTFLLFLSFPEISAQSQNSQTEPLFVNLFISADKTIYLETEQINFQEIENKVTDIIRNSPFKLDQKVVYRIFADENLHLGFIMEANEEMLNAYNENVKTERYLLNTVELNIDGQNWFKSIDMKKLKPINP